MARNYKDLEIPDGYMTLTAAAAYHKPPLTRQSVLDRVKRGVMPAIRIGCQWYVHERDVQAWRPEKRRARWRRAYPELYNE